MAHHPQRRQKKRPPPNAVQEPLSKRLCLETPEIDDAAIEPRLRRQTRVPQTPKPSRLTRKNLRLHDRMTRTTKSGAASEPGESKSASRSTSMTTKSDKTKSTTTSGFQEQATANGILRPPRSTPTHNAKETLERLNRSRETASPPESQYELYCDKIDAAGNEAAVVQRMLPLFKDYDGKYNIDMNRPFSALPKDLGFNDGLSAPQPDFVQGLTREEFLPADPSKIQGAVLFKDDLTSTTLPHFAGEWKSRTGDMVEAAFRSGYDGAAMVYGRNQAWEHLGEPDPLGHSAVTTFTSNGEHITLFAHHALPT
ncbi:heterokaryon incompatibility [Fusarium albosuccineum]|uniref:Heterokaryon incompatibility n=1 Tax=Fusarium albosuccineum TaxID=1237068 RepID=A0A8H4P9H7_9HYPO|nr:heterokaryon incompatibility [Fusarium albosuccineum]